MNVQLDFLKFWHEAVEKYRFYSQYSSFFYINTAPGKTGDWKKRKTVREVSFDGRTRFP